MRELTLVESGYIAGELVLCLVLPLLMSFAGMCDPAARRSCLKTVWMGQMLLALTALIVLLSSALAPYAAAFGLVSCLACAVLLLRRFQTARIVNN